MQICFLQAVNEFVLLTRLFVVDGAQNEMCDKCFISMHSGPAQRIDVALLFSEAMLLLDSIETVPDFEESHRTTESCNSWPFKRPD